MKGRFKENKKGIEEKVNKAIERWKQFLSEDLKSNCSTEAQGATVNTTEADLSSLINEFDIPVRYIGVGEGIEDLRPYDAKQFTDSLFS